MTLERVARVAAPHFLDVLGACHAVPGDGLGEGTIVLLGPREPGFWAHVSAEPEFAEADPIDRWSSRVIGEIAEACGGLTMLPFGEPVRPFISWALRSGRAWSSPVGLLVHDTQGLMVSFRGAVFLRGELEQTPGSSPCETCADMPCQTACPVGALSRNGYDLEACHAFLDTAPGADCMTQGCAVRRACPVSQSYGRQPEQSAYHMRQFHRQ